MEIGQLEAFLTASRLHSFSRAAEALGVSQPSLSMRIMTLEAELGELLFHRVGRGVRLTDSGRAFLPYVQRGMDVLQRGKDAIESSRTAAAGRLHIGAARGISSAVLPSIVETFHRRHPGVDVAIRTGRSSEVLALVLSEEIQVGVARALYHPEIVTTHLYDEEIVLVTGPEHRFAKEGVASIYEVGSQPLIVYDKESTYFVLIDRVCREAGIVPNISMDLDSIESTKRMIEHGLGVSFPAVQFDSARVGHGHVGAREVGRRAPHHAADGGDGAQGVLLRPARHSVPGSAAEPLWDGCRHQQSGAGSVGTTRAGQAPGQNGLRG